MAKRTDQAASQERRSKQPTGAVATPEAGRSAELASRAFFDRLSDRAQSADTLLCIGLDPHPELIVEPTAEAARDLCLRLIEATAEFACAYKPNSAFFERLGAPGWNALREIIAAVPSEIPVILDAKRGDIASTARAYAAAAFESLGAGAITLSPYLGFDAVEPFLEYPDRGVFLLCKTSNPAADEIQRLGMDDDPLFLQVARLAGRWAGPDRLGLVVGATDVQALKAVRAAAPEAWLLAPGVGAQGAELEQALQAGLRRDGLGMLLPVARAIAGAGDPGKEAARLRQAINAVRAGLAASGAQGDASGPGAGRQRVADVIAPGAGGPAGHPLEVASGVQAPDLQAVALPAELEGLADALLEAGCVRFGEFTLKDGSQSPIYFDLRLLAGRPGLLAQVAEAYLPLLNQRVFHRLAAVPYAALPIGTALALRTGRPLIYPRRERKSYGTGVAVEGGFAPGEIALVIDDLATSGGSKLEAIQALRAEGLKVTDVAVLIDRQGGAGTQLARSGCQLHAVLTMAQLLNHWERRGSVAPPSLAAARSLLRAIG